MSYLSLASRVPERSVMEPIGLTRFYNLVTQVPMVRTTHRRFIAGALDQGVIAGYGLDLGAGPGYVTLEIARQRPGLRMIGLDLAAHMVELAQRQAHWKGLDGRGLWNQADAHLLPFEDGSFDLVVSSFALHHWQDPMQAFNELARVLRRPDSEHGQPGGPYYIADLCREPNPFQRLFAYASIPALSLAFGSYGGYGGYYESIRAGYSVTEARALLDSSDLPPGEVRLDSTWFVPILTITSKGNS